MPNELTALRIIFAGTPEFAANHLNALLQTKHEICAVYTQPDRKSGRGQKLTASAVKQLAIEHNIPYYQPENLKSVDSIQTLKSFKADIMVVVAYGIILSTEVLETPRLGCINVHGSILPRWRGAAPIQRAIEAGDTETGITIMQMDSGLDTGDMLSKCSIAISNKDTHESLHDRLMKIGETLLTKTLDDIVIGKISPVSQNDALATYAKKLSKSEANLDWQLSAEQLDRKIRAFSPWPGSKVFQNGQQMKVLVKPYHSDDQRLETKHYNPGSIINVDQKGIRVACSKGSLLITCLQLPSKKMIPISSLINAYGDRFQTGQTFEL